MVLSVFILSDRSGGNADFCLISGAGLFVGSGSALTRGGGGGLVIAWILSQSKRYSELDVPANRPSISGHHVVKCHAGSGRACNYVSVGHVIFLLGKLEKQTHCGDIRVSGGFYTLASRFIDPSVGMAVGWNYFMQWAATLPYELIVASFTIQFWDANFK